MGIAIPYEEDALGRVHAPATIALVAINVIVYAFTSVENGFITIADRWVGLGAFVPAMISDPANWYRLITSMFLHANISHIFFNMLFLYSFGKHVEATIGTKRFLALYFISGLAAEIFHTALIPIEGLASAFIPALGASGAISGILAAYLILFPGTRLSMCFFYFYFPLCFTTSAAVFITFWFALQVIQGYLGASLGVAVFAHAGGFIGGLASLPYLVDWYRHRLIRYYANARHMFMNIFFTRSRRSPLAKPILVLLILVLIAGILYSATAASRADTVNKVLDFTVETRVCEAAAACTKTVDQEQVVIQVYPDGSIDHAPIASDSVRVVFNRLNALKLIYSKANADSTVNVKKSGTVRVLGIPVKLQIDATLTYDEKGVLDQGRGTVTTQVLTCTQTYCTPGGTAQYTFEARTVAKTMGLAGIPILQLSVVALALCIASIDTVARKAERLEII
ncbi:MAG: hypothetical protein DRJ35_01155 [Thermoprotei archaeon]|nr:MAG: hypothetical protein DRJ35_01155 [Thermoprotei archaeon]